MIKDGIIHRRIRRRAKPRVSRLRSGTIRFARANWLRERSVDACHLTHALNAQSALRLHPVAGQRQGCWSLPQTAKKAIVIRPSDIPAGDGKAFQHPAVSSLPPGRAPVPTSECRAPPVESLGATGSTAKLRQRITDARNRLARSPGRTPTPPEGRLPSTGSIINVFFAS